MLHWWYTYRMENLKQTIADNLVAYRKQAGLTQQELATKLNYSDKAVSKWERAEGVPDILVLKAIAELYGVTVNDFLVDHTKPKKLRLKDYFAKRWLITLLSAVLVFFVATIVVFVWMLIEPSQAAIVAKYTYITALPISMIVVLVFSCIWGKIWLRCITGSALIWTLCLLIHFVLDIVSLEHTWMIYVVGAAMQLLTILWFILVHFVNKGKANK